MPSSTTPGRILLTLAGLITAIGGYIADFNHTHVYNPRWPPHAKFHGGQTMSMGLCLGIISVYYTWRSSPNPAAERDSLMTATWVGCIYQVTQLSAWFYPGSLAIDPEFGEGFPQFWFCMAIFVIIGAGNWLERRRMEREAKETKSS